MASSDAKPVETLISNLSSNPATSTVDWSFLRTEIFSTIISLKDQIQFISSCLQENSIDQGIRLMTKVFGCSNRTYYRVCPPKNSLDSINATVSPKRRSNRCITTLDEESELLGWIKECQEDLRCPTPHQCREQMNAIIHRREPLQNVSKCWWKNWKRSVKQFIAVRSVSGIEESRVDIDQQKVNDFYQNLYQLISDGRQPELFVNMDESGFIRRFQKGKTRKVVTFRRCEALPRYRELSDSHHVTITAAISMAGSPLLPLLLSTRADLDRDIKDTVLMSEFAYKQTPRGYMNSETFEFWIRTIYLEYINEWRAKLFINDEKSHLRGTLLIDNCPSHKFPGFLQLMEENGCDILYLPPNTTHFTQPLDVGIFSIMKNAYLNTATNHSVLNCKFSKKIDHVCECWRRATSKMAIISAWKRIGLSFACNGKGYIIGVNVDATKIRHIIDSLCPPLLTPGTTPGEN